MSRVYVLAMCFCAHYFFYTQCKDDHHHFVALQHLQAWTKLLLEHTTVHSKIKLSLRHWLEIPCLRTFASTIQQWNAIMLTLLIGGGTSSFTRSSSSLTIIIRQKIYIFYRIDNIDIVKQPNLPSINSVRVEFYN